MEYRFNDIEKKWQNYWYANQVYKVENISAKPKYYVLDMFPYPSGAGLHVGHPLGYIASDIFSRYKKLKGFNVLHPMGYDSFGLPAEQYALDTGQHPALTTKNNIATFRNQLDKIGFCFDWSREFQTSDPSYYKWTQWIFLKLFNSYYDPKANKAKSIVELISEFELNGSSNRRLPTANSFTADEWKAYPKKEQEDVLMQHRLAFSAYGEVNWCEALGTVLANDEVVNGVSERGGYPVVKKKMRQWFLRITDYSDRLLEGLEKVEFSDSMKEMQRNWIGRSEGAEIDFLVKGTNRKLRVYTTRPDTIFGADFMVCAPELDLISQVRSSEQSAAIEEYIRYVKSRSEIDRMAEKKITGCFTGAYAINPFDGKEIPIWISEYVLAGYGTGAIMAVPCGDERDFKFAQHFNIPITNIIGSYFTGETANSTKEAILENSGFLNGMVMKDAINVAIKSIEENGIGIRKVNYKMRDAGFSRQRYWGEPFPITWKNEMAIPLDEKELPLRLPNVDKYGPGPEGEGPLANITEWVNLFDGRRETSTMPGYAGSSWYFLRYMDPENKEVFCDRKVSDYWNQVDLYIGGTEHAVGHLLYSRMWTKVLYDLGYIGFDEPFKKLLNQGMIQGSSRFVYRLLPTYVFQKDEESEDYKDKLTPVFISKIHYDNIEKGELSPVKFLNDYNIRESINKWFFKKHEIDGIGFVISPIRIDVNIVDGVELDLNAFRNWREEYKEAIFICEDGSVNTPLSNRRVENEAKYICGAETEKMSKSKYNTVNPDDLVLKYGADTFRMYEMFLGPVEQSKPWDTKGIEGVHRFLRKFWRLFYDELKGKIWTDEDPTPAELKILHRTIRKIGEDTERFSFNTAVSAFMVCVNELADQHCHKKDILEPLLVLLSSYAPHIAEELYFEMKGESLLQKANHSAGSAFPVYNPSFTAESEKEYPISINGKMRTTINISLEADQAEVEKQVLANEVVQKWLEGKTPRKIIFVKNKMVNLVI